MRRTPRFFQYLWLAGAGVAWGLTTGVPHAAAQNFSWNDFVVTGGVSTEGYQGNLPSVAIPLRDSTEVAKAVVGEIGVRGGVVGSWTGREQLFLSFDGGLRQFSARGFELRDYSPREWAGTANLGVNLPVGEKAVFGARVGARGRQVEDRPPMPLFLQPGHRAALGAVSAQYTSEGGHRLEVEGRGEWSDFLAPAFAPQIRLLDRRSAGIEAAFQPASDLPGVLRFHLGGEVARFPEQATYRSEDPFRRDRGLHGGVSWSWQGDFLVQLAAEGRMNRSNSRRPEYDAGTARGLVSASLPGSISMTSYLALTAKRYRFPTEFARLIPGEEANSASQAYVSFSRGLASNLDATVRVGWTRAETEIGGQYFERYGGSLLLNFRPGF
ncbi:MAG: hypothetical protein WD960_05685 [Gemmatimonadota bacterium]